MEQEISGIPVKRTTSRGGPKFSKRFSRNFLFRSILNQDFRKFWSNGTRPLFMLRSLRSNKKKRVYSFLFFSNPVYVADCSLSSLRSNESFCKQFSRFWAIFAKLQNTGLLFSIHKRAVWLVCSLVIHC